MTSRVAKIQCPSCGRKAMRRVTRDVTTRIGGRAITVAGVELQECSGCGERLYDLPALHQVNDARKAARRKRVA